MTKKGTGRCHDCNAPLVSGASRCRCTGCAEKHNRSRREKRASQRRRIQQCQQSASASDRTPLAEQQSVLNITNQDIERRLKKNVQHRLREALRDQIKSHETPEQLLGIRLERYREFISAQLEPGMSWNNLGTWCIDHVKPLKSFNLCDPLDRMHAFHYTNTQPVWADVNLKKSCKDSSTGGTSAVPALALLQTIYKDD